MLLYERLNDGYYSKRDGYYYALDDVNAERVENRLDEILEMFTGEFVRRCNDEINWYYKDENLFSYWLETIWEDIRAWKEYYTETDENNYTLYREYTKIDKLA